MDKWLKPRVKRHGAFVKGWLWSLLLVTMEEIQCGSGIDGGMRHWGIVVLLRLRRSHVGGSGEEGNRGHF